MKRTLLALCFFSVLAAALISCQMISSFSGLAGSPASSAPTQIAPIPGIVQPTLASRAVEAQPVDLTSLQDTLVKVYAQTNPGVVSLRVLTQEGGSSGSGFVYDQEGHIITNYHVVENLTDLEVAFPSGLKVHGKVIGSDLDSDIAVIHVDAPREELHPLALGDSDQVKVGQTVIAIGSPFQFNGTMTMGIVSGMGRTLESLHQAPGGNNFEAGDIIQTDAAINPGNSGGPLLNLQGEVIGINRAIFTESFSTSGQPVSSGIGFAISVNMVKRVTPSLISEGKYDYPYVGISSVSDFSLQEQDALGLPRASGVYIVNVIGGSPADKAGLRGASKPTALPGLEAGGDLIIAIDGRPVMTYGDFIGYIIKNKNPNDSVELTVLRDGQEIKVKVVLGKRPSP